MVNFIKNIIPVTVFIVGSIVEKIGRLFIGISTIIFNISSTLHMELGTTTGKKLRDIEKSVTDVMKLYAQAASQAAKKGKEEDRLANIIKNDPNIVQLGKKKDDDTKG